MSFEHLVGDVSRQLHNLTTLSTHLSHHNNTFLGYLEITEMTEWCLPVLTLIKVRKY